jgi:hypothetical protein
LKGQQEVDSEEMKSRKDKEGAAALLATGGTPTRLPEKLLELDLQLGI